jgi:hypothetical protein
MSALRRADMVGRWRLVRGLSFASLEAPLPLLGRLAMSLTAELGRDVGLAIDERLEQRLFGVPGRP